MSASMIGLTFSPLTAHLDLWRAALESLATLNMHLETDLPTTDPQRPLIPFTVPDLLRSAAQTYAERNMMYGSNYKKFGDAMAAMMPDGMTVLTPDDWNKLAVFIHIMTKVSRLVETRLEHGDSALDLAVYAAMLRELQQTDGEGPG